MELLVIIIIGYLLFIIVRSITNQPNQDKTQSDDREWSYMARPVDKPPSEELLPSKNDKLEWIPPGAAIKIHEFQIPGGMIYTGRHSGSHFWGQSEPSLIDPSLAIRPADGSTPKLDYWPSYVQIDPMCRWKYLNWLAKGRSDSTIDIGYVFIFFYGLERRLLIDSQALIEAEQEAPTIIAEVERLLAVYASKSDSFTGYASKFVELCRSKFLKEDPQTPPKVVWKGQFPLTLKLGLANFSVKDLPIPSNWALSWLEHSEFYLRTPATRCRAEFEKLFEMRYSREFRGGMIVKPNKTSLKSVYHPASSALGGVQVTVSSNDLPDITALKMPVEKLKDIANGCTDELDAYSRYLGRTEEQVTDLLALGLLPNDLLLNSTDIRIENLRTKCSDLLKDNSIAVVATPDLLRLFELSEVSTLSKAEASSVAQLLSKLGYGMEPDPRFTSDLPARDGKIVLFKSDSPIPSTPTKTYQATALVLRLAAVVAIADGHVDYDEEAMLKQQIQSGLEFSTEEKLRLEAYTKWLITNEPDLGGLKRRLSSLNSSQKEVAARFMLLLANADNKIEPAEIRTLKKIYKLLELDPESIFSDLHSIQTQKGSGPVTILRPVAGATGFAIPKAPRAPRSEGIVLNTELVEKTLQDTTEIQQVLAVVFAEEEPQALPVAKVRTEAETSILGLDPAHSGLLNQLMQRAEWSRDEVEHMCKQLLIMPNGAIETINSLTIEKFGDLLVEEGDPILINQELVKELAA